MRPLPLMYLSWRKSFNKPTKPQYIQTLMSVQDQTNLPLGDTEAPSLQAVQKCALRMVELEQQYLDEEAQAKATKAQWEGVRKTELPDMMASLELTEIVLATGHRITIRAITDAHIPSLSGIEKEKDPDAKQEMRDRLERALEYIEEMGGGSIIKRTVTVEFGAGDSEVKKAEEAILALRKLGHHVVQGKTVHPQTLNKWVREKQEAGEVLDADILDIFSGSCAEAKDGSGKKVKATKTNDNTTADSDVI